MNDFSARTSALTAGILESGPFTRLREALSDDRDARHAFNGAINHITGPMQMIGMAMRMDIGKARDYAEHLRNSVASFRQMMESPAMRPLRANPQVRDDFAAISALIEKAIAEILAWPELNA